jgi:hypothetical protein
LIEDNPHTLDDARALHAIGAAEVIEDGDEPRLSLSDARVVMIWVQLRRAGFFVSAGFPPEILGFYVEAAEYLAANEATKFLERTEGRISEQEAAAMLDVGLPRMLDFFGLLRLKFFLRNIHRARRGNDRGAGTTEPSTPRRKNRVARRVQADAGVRNRS